MYHSLKTHIASNRTDRVAMLVPLLVSLGACGGSNNSNMGPGATSYNLATGVTGLVTNGMIANLGITGTLSGVSVTGTGTFSLTPAVNDMFNGASAQSQNETVSGTVTNGTTSLPYSTSVVGYYDPGTFAFLGETSNGEFDVAQAPITYPTMVTAGSSGVLGTLSRYADQTLSTSLGTTQVSYVVKAPASTGAPATVEITDKIMDTSGALKATDVTDYSITSTNTMLLVSASVQIGGDTLTFTVQ